MSSEAKTIGMNKRTIKTALHGKEEVFRAMALAESTGLPLLLVGEPGVAKTQAMMDFAAAIEGGTHEQALKSSFVIELDEGTRPSEVKGVVDIESLYMEKKWNLLTPIADAKYIMINEVDKGTSGVRNTLLSVMREKYLMLGREIRYCKWNLFIGTCNKITEGSDDAPFWDRFSLKVRVPRVSETKLLEAWSNREIEIDVVISSPEEIRSFVPNDKDEYKKCVAQFLKIYYNKLTDRSAYQIPYLINACSIVYQCDLVEATIKAASLMVDDSALIKKLASAIEDPVITNVKSSIDRLSGINNVATFREVIKSTTDVLKDPKLTEDKKNSIKRLFKNGLENAASSGFKEAKIMLEKMSKDDEEDAGKREIKKEVQAV